MPRRYPPQVDAAIAAMIEAGLDAPEIGRRLRAGEAAAGLAPVPMPARTVREHVARLRASQPVEVEPVSAGQEIDTATAIARRLLTLLDAQVARLERLSSRRPLTASELGQVERCARTALDVRKRLEPVEAKPASAMHSAKQRAAPRSTLLDRLAREDRAQSPQGGETDTDASHPTRAAVLDA
jgi:hypothetical protein